MAGAYSTIEKKYCSYPHHYTIADCLKALDKGKEANECPPTCLCARLKSRIIHLRRNKWEAGVSLKAFDPEVRRHLPFIIKYFDMRWMLSIVETYADLGTDRERASAMIVSTMICWERFAHTALQGCGDTPKQGRPPLLGDGLPKFGLMHKADTHINLVKRTRRVLKSTPVIYALYVEIMRRMLSKYPFILSDLNEHHPRDLRKDIMDILTAKE